MDGTVRGSGPGSATRDMAKRSMASSLRADSALSGRATIEPPMRISTTRPSSATRYWVASRSPTSASETTETSASTPAPATRSRFTKRCSSSRTRSFSRSSWGPRTVARRAAASRTPST